MKKPFPIVVLSLLFLSAAAVAQEAIPQNSFSVWSRSGGATLERIDDATFSLEQKEGADCCATGTRIPVEKGEVFELSCDARSTGSGGTLSVVLYKGSEALSWSYGGVHLATGDSDFRTYKTKFIIPPEATHIVPRVMGSGACKIQFQDYVLTRVEKLEFLSDSRTLTRENEWLTLSFCPQNASFEVRDKRTNRTWRQDGLGSTYVLSARETADGIVCHCIYGASMMEFEVKIALEKDVPEMVVRVHAEPQALLGGKLAYPAPFCAEENDRIVMPLNEGISYPASEENPGIGYTYFYGGHGLCMAFAGQMEEATQKDGSVVGKSAFMMIFETPDDAGVLLRKDSDKHLLCLAPQWEAQMGKFGYDRCVRYVFFAEGGHVAMAKRYRNYAKETGLCVTFREKVRRNPALKDGIDKLIGAVNVWYFGPNKVERYREMQSLGIKRILASAGGSAEELKTMNEMPNVLTSRYDIYQDAMDPAQFPNLNGIHGDWTSSAWPHDLMLDANGNWRRGWEVAHKDKTKPRIPCGVLCDRQAPPYAVERISKELKEKPFKARFIDTTTASPWRECYHPDHPMTRSESKFWKMKLLELLGKEFNLVCGCETGHDASVPYCDFFEGMMSLGPYRVPDSGRNLTQIWDEAPERVAKFQLGEKYRLPLWELVYHDCTVSYWYWGDYNNKIPSLWDKRDLFNALYGVPPMFLFTPDVWERSKERFVESYRVAQPVSRLTGYEEMTNHRILVPDRTVQQTEFANGVVVTTNFGSQDFTMKDGFVLKGMKSRVEKRR
ncbi:MAG: glycoside hydrolase [Planctomycetia bacterium]|nr:glycoside hydrolase [Planctomycetia bacterium]